MLLAPYKLMQELADRAGNLKQLCFIQNQKTFKIAHSHQWGGGSWQQQVSNYHCQSMLDQSQGATWNLVGTLFLSGI